MDAGGAGGIGVGLADANAFFAAKLLEGEAGLGRIGEAQTVHAHDDLEASEVVGDEARLKNEVAAVARAAHALGVEADAVLADPDDQAVVVGQRLDRLVADLRARPEQQDGQRRGGNGAWCRPPARWRWPCPAAR